MTAVVGVRGKKGVLLAADSLASDSWLTRQRKDSKVFQLSPLVAIAYCGSFRLGQILTYHMTDLEDPPLGRDEARWAVKEFIPHLRAACEENGYLHIHHNVENLGDSGFLLAIRGRLFAVEGDLQVSEDLYIYSALGSGEDVAMGAMNAILGAEENPISSTRQMAAATAGIEAAIENTPFVGGAITSVRTVLFTKEEQALAKIILASV